MLHCGNEIQVSKRNTLLYFLHLVNILMFYALVSTLVFECDRSPKDNCGVFHAASFEAFHTWNVQTELLSLDELPAKVLARCR